MIYPKVRNSFFQWHSTKYEYCLTSSKSFWKFIKLLPSVLKMENGIIADLKELNK